MSGLGNDKLWVQMGLTRREFLRHFGIASGALFFSPNCMIGINRAFGDPPSVRVYKSVNGDCFQNTAKVLEMAGGIQNYVDPTDVVVIKGNGQWPNQGYTHTGCIKGVIDKILDIPGYSGEVFICDNTQNYGTAGRFGFDAEPSYRNRNWPDHNWNSLAAEYQGLGKPVATKRWINQENESTPETDVTDASDGEGWVRDFFNMNECDVGYDKEAYLSYPIFESPLTAGRMIDMKRTVWEGSAYTERKVKTIFMPNLNNHGSNVESYAGITSAIKCFLGASEIIHGPGSPFRGHMPIHYTCYPGHGPWSGEIMARYVQTMYAPVLYMTAAMWSGAGNRAYEAGSIETKTVYACENPATLDYVACKDMTQRYPGQWPTWLNPDLAYNTRRAILGAVNYSCTALGHTGIGTITPGEFEVISYDFDNPSVTRIDIDNIIKDYKNGTATEQQVKDLIAEYMESQ
jgi:hypothetical protein